MVYLLLSARTESRGAFVFNSLHDSQFHIVGKAPALSFTRAVLADVQAYDDVGVLRFMSKKNGKPCKKCGESEWYTNGKCAPCSRKVSRQWRESNPEKVVANNRQWAKENPERKAAGTRRWRESNTEKIAAYDRRRRENEPEMMAARYRRWWKSNPEKTAARINRRRTLKTKAGGSYTAAEWKALVEYHGGKCLCCGRDDVKLTADHVVPVSKGGTSNIENIQPLCKSCNSRKKDKTTDYRPIVGFGRWIQRKLFG